MVAHKDESIATPSRKAYVTTEKYLYHMSIYCQLQRFSREGIILSDTTVGDWINNTCHSLTAIYDALRTDIIYSASKYMMANETSTTVLDIDKLKGKKVISVMCGLTATQLIDLYFLNTRKVAVINMQEGCSTKQSLLMKKQKSNNP